MRTKLLLGALVIGTAFLGIGCLDIIGYTERTLDPGATGGTGGTAGMGGTTSMSGTAGMGGTGGTTSTGMVCEPGTTMECYSGPPTTHGIGICHGGTRACKEDGSGYEDVCEGEVIPQPETCADTTDEDCDNLDCVQWAAVFGDESEQVPLDIGVDQAGNTYVLGAFKGAIKFASPGFVSAGGWDLFLVKLDSSGKVLWSKQFGDATDQANAQIAVDAAGNVAVAGKLTGTLDFGGANLVGKDLFVAMLDPAGAHQWSKGFAVSSAGTPQLSINPTGDVILWTDFLGTADFGTGSLMANPDRKSVLVSFTPDTGDPSWLKTFVSTGAASIPGGAYNHTKAWALDVDSSGNISVAGVFNGTKINLGDSDILESAPGFGGGFLARFDKLGSHAWSVGEYPIGQLSADPEGGVSMVTTDDAGGFAPCFSAYVIHYSNVGAKQWTNTYDCPDQGKDFVSINAGSDSQGNIILAMVPPDAVFTFGNTMLPPYGGADIVLGKLDGEGQHLWGRRFGDAADQKLPVVATAPNGDIVMAAQVSGTFDVGTGPLMTKGLDLLIARFGP